MISVNDLWKFKQGDKQSGVEWWDSMAEDFSRHELPTPENSLAMRIIEREGLLRGERRVLDVGCGTGRYCAALAERGALAHGVDISPKMLEYANKTALGKRNIDFSLCDWHEQDLSEKGWKKGFDLVLANMTPAVADASSFLKLSEASRGSCLLLKPSRRTNSVLDPLNKLVCAQSDTEPLDETISYAFALLWQNGFCPRLEYEPQTWMSRKPLDEAVYQYTKRIGSNHSLDERGKNIIAEYLSSRAENGFVEEVTDTTVVAIFWHV